MQISTFAQAKNRLSSLFVVVTVLLLLAQLVFPGMLSLKRIVWSLRRHANCHSSCENWQIESVPHGALIREIRQRVPPTDTLRVTSDSVTALDIAFFVFPRRTIWLGPPASAPTGYALVRSGSNDWSVCSHE